MAKEFTVLDDVLTPEDSEKIQRFFERFVKWEFGSQSSIWKAPFGHWNHDFVSVDPRNQGSVENQLIAVSENQLISTLWNKIKKRIGHQEHELVRCYANAHTYGVEGYAHIDHRAPGNFTTLVYVNPFWAYDWAGETVLINEVGDIVCASLPKRGRILHFDGRITHAARSVSRLCPALRVTLVFKSRSKCSAFDVPYELNQYLVSVGCGEVPHTQNYSLLDHLKYTYLLLREYGANEDVCLAGLFHSIHGTQIFDSGLRLNADNEETIKHLIGEKAAKLVEVFSLLDRPQILEQSIKTGNHNWTKNFVDKAGARQLAEDILLLECANLVDQKALYKYPGIAEHARKIGFINEQYL